MKPRLLVIPFLLTAFSLLANAQTTVEQEDKYVWLEDVLGTRSMDWVNAHNAATLKDFESDPRFATLQAQALKIRQAPDRIPSPEFQNGMVYNTWNDNAHVRGILRRTTLNDYLNSSPSWQTIVDYDALGKAEGKSWVAAGYNSLYPSDELTLISLSEGGEDAHTMREFNLKTGKFVEGGFVVPTAKSNVAWVDKDTLMVATDWGAGTMTESGYPSIVKVWKRGTALADSPIVFEGKKTDVSVDPFTLNDAQGHQLTMISQGVSFFESELYIWSPNGVKHLSLPKQNRITGFVNNQLILITNQDWKPNGSTKTYVKGSVLAFDATQLAADPDHSKPTAIFVPTKTEFVSGASTTKNKLILTTIDNVMGRPI